MPSLFWEKMMKKAFTVGQSADRKHAAQVVAREGSPAQAPPAPTLNRRFRADVWYVRPIPEGPAFGRRRENRRERPLFRRIRRATLRACQRCVFRGEER